MELYYIVYITINLCNGKFYIGVHRTNPDIFDGYIGNGIYNLSTANKKSLTNEISLVLALINLSKVLESLCLL